MAATHESAGDSVGTSRTRQVAILKALADPRRYELLERISQSECGMACTTLRACAPISAATLSHHIKELEMAGLIDVRKEGKFHFLSLRAEVLEELAATLSSLAAGKCPDR